MNRKFYTSKFGTKFRRQTGIGQLMEDLGNPGQGVSMLGGGSPALIPEVEEAWKEILSKLTATGSWESILGKYESPSGKEETLEAFAELLQKESGMTISKDQIAITNGSQNAFYLLLNFFSGAFPDGSKRKALFPTVPEYIGYIDQPIEEDSIYSLPAIYKETGIDTFRYELDEESLSKLQESNDSLGCTVLSRPTNPTGRVASEEEIGKLLTFSGKKNIPLLVDNAYGFPFPGIVYGTGKWFHREGMIQGFSLSKIGLPGVRTGFVLADPEIIASLNKANAVLNLTSGSLGQYVGLEFLKSGVWHSLSKNVVLPYYTRKRSLALATIRREWAGKFDYKIHESEGAFFLWVRVKGLAKSLTELYPILKQEGVVIIPGRYFFPLGGPVDPTSEECARISFAREDMELQDGLRKIGEVFRKFTQ
ncbi:aminotransferase, class I/II [Leptospira inadai serovar Lyme str. 10]|uniref:Aminotransferase, class I/II n=2 Tax=Leptospira inadai serovar Lyme TaxID=293084 RepID=V6HR69_9LEPT|nr:pyridoxal phosphate-dependent aminotransferase [Leptospira inadai]EQA34974.1 aminotransferase, class I/II [Leptospira inadai serovar Lyme str. 10]PNV73107.1 valine--pyruvate transaminase [Leptospira inadai serovar Lyme]